MNNQRFACRTLFILTGVLLIGCGTRSGRPATSPVRGKVTYEGKPVAGAIVTFLAPGAPRLAFGTTDETGAFRLTTYEPNDGAVIGTHAVTVTKTADEFAAQTHDETVADPTAGQAGDSSRLGESIEQAMQETAMQMKAAGESPSLLPAKYSNHRTTDLRVEVRAGDNVIKIELVD